ncbi:MAG: UDP-glucose 4-epimerase GalE [Hyphomicrobiales bacterium]|nr:UDP-glucose 4-epimerase GalE [Hyphomicrobiales bacterium]
MSVLVTGGAGYIGSHMVWELLDHGEEVVVLDNLSTGFRWAVADRAKFIEGDIADQRLVENIILDDKIDTIIHFAGSVVVPESIKNPLKYYDNNTGKSRSLVQAAVNCGIDKFIFSSTAAVYGLPENSNPVLENAVLTPMSPYGSSKLMTEMMIRDVANAYDLRYVMLRYFNVAGADGAGRVGLSTEGATHLIKLACEAALGRRPYLEIYGTDYDTPDGSGVRDFIHISDLVNAHYYALNFLREGGLKFTANCGYSKGYSVLEVIEAVKRVSGCDFEIRHAPRREGDIGSIIANADRLMSRLGWSPKYDNLDYIIATALAWEGNLIEYKKQA